MIKGQHCYFYAQPIEGPLVTYAAHYDRDNGDGTHRAFARLDDGSEVPVDGPQCDPAAPIAGCWSELP